jgi:hypothetical protein
MGPSVGVAFHSPLQSSGSSPKPNSKKPIGRLSLVPKELLVVCEVQRALILEYFAFVVGPNPHCDLETFEEIEVQGVIQNIFPQNLEG